MKSRRLCDLFSKNEHHFEQFSVQSGDLLLDYSKNFLNAITKELLVNLARDANVEKARHAMFTVGTSTRQKAVLCYTSLYVPNSPIRLHSMNRVSAIFGQHSIS